MIAEILSVLGWLGAAAVIWLGWQAWQHARALTTLAESVTREQPRPSLPPPLPGALGRVQRAVVRMVGTADQRLAAARDEQRRLEAVLEGMVEGVLVIDASGTVLRSNHRAEVLLELPPRAAHIGRPLIELTRHPDLHDLVNEVKAAGGRTRSSAREVALDGAGQHVLQVTATPMDTARDAGRAYILVFHDISEMKRLERIRRDFVANVSHELRTPLAAIGGYTETLLAGALDDPDNARRFLGIVERHTERLGRLVDDLLTLSDLELGRTQLRRSATRAETQVEAAFEVVRHKAERKGVALERRIAPDTPALDADEDRFAQALLNLVDNSIKYTPKGGQVTVSARAVPPNEVPDSATGTFVEIAVSDTGIGVPAQDLPRLTERFYRVDKARSRELGGTGLGLAIVKHIVQAHGGWMRIESQLNQGTTVRLYLPAFDGPVDEPQ